MNQPSHAELRLVALFPHEDASRPLRIYRSRLLTAGFLGAFSFPLCAPIAVLNRPLTKDELSMVADVIRASAARSDPRGRIFAASPRPYSVNGLPSRLALPLSVSTPALPLDAVRTVCAEIALVLALLDMEDGAGALPVIPERTGPTLFRAAYLANVVVRSAESGNANFSYDWEIGEPRWLPGGAR